MLFSRILENYRKRRERRDIVIELIRSLPTDVSQKRLFLDSLEALDDQGMEMLYARLMQFVESVE